jgi:hypothetical protein
VQKIDFVGIEKIKRLQHLFEELFEQIEDCEERT